MKLFKKGLNLSDKQPLTFMGKVGLTLTYIILLIWSSVILWPLYEMILSAFNGKQQAYLMLNKNFEFSL